MIVFCSLSSGGHNARACGSKEKKVVQLSINISSMVISFFWVKIQYFLKALMERCMADDMVSFVVCMNKYTPQSTLGTFEI